MNMPGSGAWALILAFGLVSCQSKGLPSDSLTAPIEGYIEALGRRDFDAAMTFLCTDGRVGREGQSLFEAHLDQLMDQIGFLEGVEAEVLGPANGDLYSDLADPIEMSYRLRTRGQTHSPLLGVVAVEAGERRLCGTTTLEAEAISEKLGQDYPAGPTVRLGPKELLSFALPPGAEEVESVLAPALEEHPGELDGWTRAWRLDQIRTIRATASPFATFDQAVRAARDDLVRRVPTGVEVIDRPSWAHVRGLRTLAYGWLGVQPPDEPPFLDSLVAVHENMLVIVSVAGSTASTPTEVIEAMSLIQDRARAA